MQENEYRNYEACRGDHLTVQAGVFKFFNILILSLAGKLRSALNDLDVGVNKKPCDCPGSGVYELE